VADVVNVVADMYVIVWVTVSLEVFVEVRDGGKSPGWCPHLTPETAPKFSR